MAEQLEALVADAVFLDEDAFSEAQGQAVWAERLQASVRRPCKPNSPPKHNYNLR